MKDDAPFKSFNCADYYNNPQLLMSQLFGYAKGAFTGADQDHEGLVEKADGGVLLLDEVHRLPPEGQEMLFISLTTAALTARGKWCQTTQQSVDHMCNDRKSRLSTLENVCQTDSDDDSDPVIK